MKTNEKISIFGVNISPISLTDFFSEISNALHHQKRILIGNVNIHALNLAWEDPVFRKALNACDIVFCDGFGVKLGACHPGRKITQRYTPPDFIHPLMKLMIEEGGGVYLLGAKPGVAAKAAHTLQQHTPGVHIAGCQHGYFDKSPHSPENKTVKSSMKRLESNSAACGFRDADPGKMDNRKLGQIERAGRTHGRRFVRHTRQEKSSAVLNG